MKVQVYWNSRKRQWSVRDSKTRKVIARRNRVILEDATFHVSQAGRDRVLRTGEKNVHAYAEGTWVEHDLLEDTKYVNTVLYLNAARDLARRQCRARIGYSPRGEASFVTGDAYHLTPVTGAELAYFDAEACRGAFRASGLTYA